MSIVKKKPDLYSCHHSRTVGETIVLCTISLQFVPGGPIYNITTLVQIMACRRLGDRPLSDRMMVNLLTHTRRSLLMCNESTFAGTSLEGAPMFAHVTLHRTFNPVGSKCPWWQDEEGAS